MFNIMAMVLNKKTIQLEIACVGKRSFLSIRPIIISEHVPNGYCVDRKNRGAMVNEVLTPEVLQHIANALEYRQYMFDRERSRREAVRIERERREKLEDDERWERLARHMEEYRNLLRSRSRPRR
jgi:hypothetical protein